MVKSLFTYLNLFAFWSFLMLLFMLVPFNDLKPVPRFDFELMDKMVHIFIFGTHSFLMAGYLKKEQKITDLTTGFFPAIIILSFLYGFLIEILQYFIPERSFEIFDLIANFIGILLGTLIFYLKFNFFTN
ncbi:MAG: VanZ family protein [Cyclobacteriaceae bacterium]|nr:VanZ family protein [Cyclobacteriaceae bacterium]